MRRSVDLPQPLGPTSATNSCVAICSETSRKASVVSGNDKQMSSAEIKLDPERWTFGLGVVEFTEASAEPHPRRGHINNLIVPIN